MIGSTPSFIDEHGWKLKEDLTQEQKREIERYMESLEMIKEEELNILLKSLIGTTLAIKVNSNYIDHIIRFDLSGIMFSSRLRKSKVSNALIKGNNVSLHDKNHNVCFQFEYKDVESMVKDDIEGNELHLIYRDGTDVMIYKEAKISAPFKIGKKKETKVEKKPFPLYVYETTKKELDDIVKKTGYSRNELVNKMIDYCLDNIKFID